MKGPKSVLETLFGMIRAAITQGEPLVVMVSRDGHRMHMTCRREADAVEAIAAVRAMDRKAGTPGAFTPEEPPFDATDDAENLW